MSATDLTVPIAPLSLSQQRLAEHLICGLTLPQIAIETGLSHHTVKTYLGALRIKFRCPPRSSLPVLVHALIRAEQAIPPAPTQPTPSLDAQQLLLLRALAEHTGNRDIAKAANIEPADVRTDTDALIAEAGAKNAAHLVVLAHGWGLLNQDQTAMPVAEN